MRIPAVVLALLVTLLSIAAAFAGNPPAGAPAIDEAALQVNLEVQSWDTRRKGCSRLLPEQAARFSTSYMRWLDKNRAPIQGMLAFAEQAKMPVAAWSVITKGLGDGVEQEAQQYKIPPKDFCVRMFSNLESGEFDIARSYPDVDQVLAGYLTAHPLSTQAARTYDHPLGCMKSALNKKFDYDAVIPMCSCLWNATNSEFSAAEWKEYEAAVGAPDAQTRVQALPQFKRLQPKLAACAKLLPAS